MWSLTLMEEHILQMSETKVLRKIPESNNKETCEKFRILHNKELHDLDRSPSFVRTVKSKRL